MFHRALLAAGLWVFLSPLAGLLFAEDSAPGVANVFTPPAAPASEAFITEAFRDSTEETASEEIPAPKTPEPRPSSASTSDGETILVPAPAEGIILEQEAQSATPEAANPIPTGPGTGESGSRLKDFSYTRWRPFSRTQWLPGHRDRFGMFSLAGESAVVWENWGGLSSTHGYGVHFLNGPVRSDLPSKLFDLTWGLNWTGKITSGWTASLSGQVGLFTDFEDSVRDGWRFPAHAVVFHDWTDAVQGVAGVKSLDRENLPPLPVLGFIFRPDDRVRVEALFPEPRIAWRVHADETSENWLSLSGEIGGGEWAIERSNTDLADIVTYNDYSAVLGFHHHAPGQHEQAFEIGYVFARDLEYRSGVGDFRPEDTFFIRWSSHF